MQLKKRYQFSKYVWLWENFVLPYHVLTDVVQSEKMSNKLKIILKLKKIQKKKR